MSGAAVSPIAVSTGQRFGYWTVVGPLSPGPGQRARWLCRCVCGIEREVLAQTLRKRESASCGCKAYSNRIDRRMEREAAALRIASERREAIELLKAALICINPINYSCTVAEIDRFLVRLGEPRATTQSRTA
jgi:hypothetical protein